MILKGSRKNKKYLELQDKHWRVWIHPLDINNSKVVVQYYQVMLKIKTKRKLYQQNKTSITKTELRNFYIC